MIWQRAAPPPATALLEKPIEGTLERSERLVATCATAGTKLGIVFQNRFRTPHLRLAALLREGRLGELVSVSLAVRWWRPDSYFAELDRGMRSRDGGGVLLTQAIHAYDAGQRSAGRSGGRGLWLCHNQSAAPDRHRGQYSPQQVSLGRDRVLDATTTSFGSPERIDIAGRQVQRRWAREQLVCGCATAW